MLYVFLEARALKQSLSRSMESCLDLLKHWMIRCGKKYRLLKILLSLQHLHLPVIILLLIKLTSEVGGIGAFVQISLKTPSKSPNSPGSTTLRGESSTLLCLIADSAAISYCCPIILFRRYFARTVEKRSGSWPSSGVSRPEYLNWQGISTVVIARACMAKVPIWTSTWEKASGWGDSCKTET